MELSHVSKLAAAALAGGALAIGAVPASAAVGGSDAFSGPNLTTNFSSTTAGATGQAGEPEHGGDGVGGTGTAQNSIWYTVVGNNEWIVIDTCDPHETSGNRSDTVIAVYTGGPGVNQLTPHVANNETAFCPNSSNSSVTFFAQNGVTYHVAVDGYLGATGDFQISKRSDTFGPDVFVDPGAPGPNSITYGFIVREYGGFVGPQPAVACSLDGAPFTPCSSPQTIPFGPLADGEHNFSVRGTDAAGNGKIVTKYFTVSRSTSSGGGQGPPQATPLPSASQPNGGGGVPSGGTRGPIAVTNGTVDTGIDVSCPAGGSACAALGQITTNAVSNSASVAKRKKRKKAKNKPMACGIVNQPVAAGQTERVRIPLNAKAKALLAKRGSLPVTIGVVVQGSSGSSAPITRKAVLKAPKAKKKSRR